MHSKFNQLGRIFSLITLFSFILLSILPSNVNATGNVVVTLSPSSGSIGQAEQSININLNTIGTAISSVLLNITYDPAVLSVTFAQGTIAELNQGSIPLTGDVSSGLVNIQAGTNINGSGYNGSGLLAVLKVKVLTAITVAQDTQMTIASSSKITTSSDANTNQLAASVLGATSTFSADPTFQGKNLPGTAIFDDNRVTLIAQILIGISLVYLGVRAIKIKSKRFFQ